MAEAFAPAPLHGGLLLPTDTLQRVDETLTKTQWTQIRHALKTLSDHGWRAIVICKVCDAPIAFANVAHDQTEEARQAELAEEAELRAAAAVVPMTNRERKAKRRAEAILRHRAEVRLLGRIELVCGCTTRRVR